MDTIRRPKKYYDLAAWSGGNLWGLHTFVRLNKRPVLHASKCYRLEKGVMNQLPLQYSIETDEALEEKLASKGLKGDSSSTVPRSF